MELWLPLLSTGRCQTLKTPDGNLTFWHALLWICSTHGLTAIILRHGVGRSNSK